MPRAFPDDLDARSLAASPIASPLVSIVTPVFQQVDFLGQCVRGLEEQCPEGGQIEVIFVDNGSTDGSVEWIAAHPRLRLLRESRRGAYAARNTGAMAASGAILAFIDCDCVPGPRWLASMLDAFRDPEVLVVLGERRPRVDRGLIRLLADYESAKDRWMIGCGEPLKYYGYTNNMAVRRQAWLSCGPFLERARGSDTLFVRKVVDQYGTGVVRFASEMTVKHLEIDGIISHFRKVFIYGRSHQSYRQVIPSHPLSFTDRVAILRGISGRASMGPIRSLLLAVLLILGLIVWIIGRLAGLVDDLRSLLTAPLRSPS